MNKIEQLRRELEQQKGQRTQIERSISKMHGEIRQAKRHLRRHEQALEIIRIVGMETQNQLSYHISDITSLALEAVFDNPYKLMVEFVQRRNKTECDLYFERNGNRIDPLSASGLGAVDVAGFALRVASWSMQTPRSRATLILDEPFKHLKGRNANLRVLDMIKEISDKLKLQIIMVSDERVEREDIIEHADKVFDVSIRDGISKIN